MSLETKTDQIDSFQTAPDAMQLTSREQWLEAVAGQHGIGKISLSHVMEPVTVEKAYEYYSPELAAGAALELLHAIDDDDPRVAELSDKVDALEDDRTESRIRGKVISSDDEYARQVYSMLAGDQVIGEMLSKRDLKRQHETLKELMPQLIESYKAGLKHGIDLGYIPADRTQIFNQAVTKTVVRVADSLVMTAAFANRYAHGSYNAERNEVLLRDRLVKNYVRSFLPWSHEMTHQISGGTFISGSGEFGPIERVRIGFGSEIKTGVQKRAAFNEILDHQATLGIMTGDFETFDPDKRQDKNKVYYPIRKVGAAFVDLSQGVIDKKVLMHAFFEDAGPGGSSQNTRLMLRQINQAWGKGALGKMDKLYDLADNIAVLKWGGTSVRDKLEELVLGRITPPVVDENGQVLKTGNIDISDLPYFFEIVNMRDEAARVRQEAKLKDDENLEAVDYI